MSIVQAAEDFVSVVWWSMVAPLALAVALILADVAVGILAAWHARRGGEGPHA